MHTHIYAFANQKGGVGKTTSAVNLATALAAVKKRVLLIDLDPQGNASTGLGIRPEQREISVYDLFHKPNQFYNALQRTAIPDLYVIPSSIHLAGAEVELVNMPDREFCLKNLLAPHLDAFDYIFIDCPPALNLLTLNAMVAATGIMVTLQTEFYALEGLSHLIHTITQVRKMFNPILVIEGVILTMVDARNNLSMQVIEDVRHHFGETVFQTAIPRNVKVSEAPSHGKPVVIYDHKSAGAKAYLSLASEIIKRNIALENAERKVA